MCGSLVSVTLSSCGKDVSAYVVVANDVSHGSHIPPIQHSGGLKK